MRPAAALAWLVGAWTLGAPFRRLGAPAPEWTAELPSGRTSPLPRLLGERKPEAVVLAPGPGSKVSRDALDCRV